MSPIKYKNLAQQLSRAISPYLVILIRGESPASFLPGIEKVLAIWQHLETHIQADPGLRAHLEELGVRPDQKEVKVILSWEMENLLSVLPDDDVQNLSSLVTKETIDVSLSDLDLLEEAAPTPIFSDPGDTLRSWDPGSFSLSGAAPEPMRSWDPAATPEDVSESLESSDRFLRAEITEGDHSLPLPPNQEFTLAFFIALEAGGEFDAASRFEEEGVFAPDEQIARLQVVVSSRDFTVHTRDPQELRVPRTGPSRNKARFDLEPRKDWSGTGEITALFYKENNFIQGMTLRLNVGIGERVFRSPLERLGRSLEGISLLKPRDLLLFIKKMADGFDLTMVGAVSAQAFLRISPQALNEKVAEARNTLLDVVYLAQRQGDVFVQPMNRSLPAGASMPYQIGLDIPDEMGEVGMVKLAEAGWLLYDGLFYGEGMGADANAMGDILRAKANAGTLKLQIVSQEFFLPWGLLYMADFVDPENIDPEHFLGMKHIIEHIPLQNDMQVHDERIPSHELAVSLNLDTNIDAALKLNVIADQRSFWDQLANKHQVSLELRENSSDFLDGMRTSAEQILYFYGHAVSQDLSEVGGTGGSSLSFSDQKTVTLRDLKLRAPARMPFPNSPLVFINACESAELSPLFYGGFMPYFISKGARGMVGTECQVPAIFAAEWADRFFKRFLFEGRPIGALFLEMRREFFYQHNNPLGLLYALYCNGDTRLSPPLELTG